ncbi:hypothetical protein niasHS_000008 [Heterodera schachtii]|uniref:Uncharacterized protein n=1 Tax=Heterodera schachtii TaxID=97005 RepID=A0ABD2KND8_HETSC
MPPVSWQICQAKTNTSPESICPLLAAEVPLPVVTRRRPIPCTNSSVRPFADGRSPPPPPRIIGLTQQKEQAEEKRIKCEKWWVAKLENNGPPFPSSKFLRHFCVFCPPGAKVPSLAAAVALTGHGLATGHTKG